MKQYLRILFVAALLSGAVTSATTLASEAPRIEHSDANQPVIKVTAAGELELTAPDPDASVRFEIYSITGQLVKSLELRNTTERVELPKGCYIVRTPGRSQKIVVR